MFRVGLIQMRSEKADFAQNLAAMAATLREAATIGVDFVAFPEMSLSGYIDPTRAPHAVLTLDAQPLRDFLDLTCRHNAMVSAGFVEHNPRGKPFITQIVARQGELLGVYRKITIRDEEEAWFTPGPGSVLVVECAGYRVGIAICADIHNEQVFTDCRKAGAQIVLELAAPGLYGEQASRNWQSGYAWWEGECQAWLGEYARRLELWICVATQAGRTLDEDFPGGGYVFSPDGARLFTTGGWEPGAAYVALDLSARSVIRLGGH